MGVDRRFTISGSCKGSPAHPITAGTTPVSIELLSQFPDSPTAQHTLKAYSHFLHGWKLLTEFISSRNHSIIEPLTDADCRHLEYAFHSYLVGVIKSEFMLGQFCVADLKTVLSSYIKHSSDDLKAHYLDFYLNVLPVESIDGKSNYVSNICKINWLEEFLQKLSKDNETSQLVLWSVYHKLGTLSYVAQQEQRAVDYFEKCFALDMTSLPAMYALGFSCRNKFPLKALSLLENFVQKAPKCDEKYANALYTIGLIYFNHYQNNEKAKLYYYKGIEAENHRLPFHPPVQFDPKTILQLFMRSETEVNWFVLMVLTAFACVSICTVVFF